jgi:serine/threonine protein kinase
VCACDIWSKGLHGAESDTYTDGIYIDNLQIHSFVRSTGSEYALKVIDKSKCHGKEHMIESEVSILRRVHHPNIIQLVAEYDTPSELYLVMELIKVSSRSWFIFTLHLNCAE